MGNSVEIVEPADLRDEARRSLEALQEMVSEPGPDPDTSAAGRLQRLLALVPGCSTTPARPSRRSASASR